MLCFALWYWLLAVLKIVISHKIKKTYLQVNWVYFYLGETLWDNKSIPSIVPDHSHWRLFTFMLHKASAKLQLFCWVLMYSVNFVGTKLSYMKMKWIYAWKGYQFTSFKQFRNKSTTQIDFDWYYFWTTSRQMNPGLLYVFRHNFIMLLIAEFSKG